MTVTNFFRGVNDGGAGDGYDFAADRMMTSLVMRGRAPVRSGASCEVAAGGADKEAILRFEPAGAYAECGRDGCSPDDLSAVTVPLKE